MLQAIVMPEQGYKQYLDSVDFIQRYVFPGGCLPSLGAMLASIGRTTDLRFVQAEDFAPHYAETLRRWRRAFHKRLDDVRRLGYSDEFIRLWNYYLCYCEAAFEERHVGVLQVQFDKPECRREHAFIPDGCPAAEHGRVEMTCARSLTLRTVARRQVSSVSPLIQTLLANLFVIMFAMIALWIVSTVRRDASIVDPFWGFGFVIVAWVAWFINPLAGPRVAT